MKKYKALTKDIFKEIWKTRNRFLSILLIVMLGSGFFAGVKSTCPNMKDTAEKYFKDQNLFDFQLKSSMGFTEGDIESLSKEENVKNIYVGYTADLFMKTPLREGDVARLYSIDLEKMSDDDTINRLVLLEGRMPQNERECVLDQSLLKSGRAEIGDSIKLYAEADKKTSDYLKRNTFEVVGFVQNPMYINFERGNTTMGNGSVVSTCYIDEKAFNYEVYTDVFLTYEDMKGAKFFEKSYEDLVLAKTDYLEEFGNKREKTRHDEIYDEALKEIEKAEKELNDGKAEYEENLAKFNKEIADAEKKLKDGKAEMNKAENLINSNRDEINKGWIEYHNGVEDVNIKKAELENGNSQVEDGLSKLKEGEQLISSIEAVILQFESQSLPENAPILEEIVPILEASASLNQYTEDKFDFKETLTKYLYITPQSAEKLQTKAMLSAVTEGAKGNFATQKEQLEVQKTQIADGLVEIAKAEETLNNTKLQLDDGENELYEGIRKLASSKRDYDKGIIELKENKADGEVKLAEALSELNDGEAKILEARHDLSEMGDPEWYIFDRTDNPGYGEFSDDAERVDRIAKVFPVFFIIVAALVCLTTMTRMVEEQRMQIGTLKSLGYGKGAAVAKYLVYALSASFIGSVLGLILGFNILPKVIFEAYRIMYILPDVLLPFRWDYALGCTGIAMAVTGIAAFSACSLELKEVPAQLLRPKPPKTGKRVLLERVGFIWNRLSFLKKVTIRNLFRYKKRIYMTVVGVAGCTALMMAGFGLQNAITSIVDRQYEDIFLFDALAVNKEKLSNLELKEIENTLQSNKDVESFDGVLQENMTFSKLNEKHEAYLFVPKNLETLDKYINLQNRKSKESITLSDEGVVINEKLAKLLKAEKGQTINMTLSSGKKVELKVVDISENYLMNYVYMTENLYEEIFEKDLKTNGYLMNLAENYDADSFSVSLLKNNNILGVSYSEEGGDKFREIVGSLNYIVLVLIICAGALAFVVLYNLANINVEERLREIATIKVLGFFDNEVSAYIFRESIISSMMGTVVGLGVGVPFIDFIVMTAEVDAVMFNPEINWESFAFSALLTIIFTLIVNWATHFRLKKVDMVSSLKSVE